MRVELSLSNLSKSIFKGKREVRRDGKKPNWDMSSLFQLH